jgi:hypothetical protein
MHAKLTVLERIAGPTAIAVAANLVAGAVAADYLLLNMSFNNSP